MSCRQIKKSNLQLLVQILNIIQKYGKVINFTRPTYIQAKTILTLTKSYGFPSFPTVDKAMAFGSFKPAAIASSNHLRNCR